MTLDLLMLQKSKQKDFFRKNQAEHTQRVNLAQMIASFLVQIISCLIKSWKIQGVNYF